MEKEMEKLAAGGNHFGSTPGKRRYKSHTSRIPLIGIVKYSRRNITVHGRPGTITSSMRWPVTPVRINQVRQNKANNRFGLYPRISR